MLFLYVLGIDADAVRKGVAACNSKFVAFTPVYESAPVTCGTPYQFIFIAVVDAAAFVLLVLLAGMTWGRLNA